MEIPARLRLPVFCVLLLAVAVAAFVAVRSVRNGDDKPASAATETPVPSGPQGPTSSPFDADNSLPRFEGELLGLYLVPPSKTLPAEYRNDCTDATPSAAEWGQMGSLDLSAIKMPDGYTLSSADEPGAGAYACAGKPWAGGIVYTRDLDNGFQAKVYLTANFDKGVTVDAPHSRITTTQFAGHQAIVVEPVIADGRQTVSQVIFPGAHQTEIYALDLPYDDLLALANAVAGQLK